MAETTTNPNSAEAATTGNGATEEVKGSNSKAFTQDEVDAIVAAQVKREASKSEELTRKAVADALAGQERKSKLTEEQRLSEERKAKDDELAEKERNITIRENRADAIEQLAKLGISADLADFVINADKGKTSENVKKLEKAFNKAVEASVG